MSLFLTLIHSGGGSTVEAANAQATLGPHDSRDKAIDHGEAVLDALGPIDSYFRDEFFYTVVEVPDPPTDLKTIIKALLVKNGHPDIQVMSRDEYERTQKP